MATCWSTVNETSQIINGDIFPVRKQVKQEDYEWSVCTSLNKQSESPYPRVEELHSVVRSERFNYRDGSTGYLANRYR
eukprot:3077327-Pyramimonas_sp.AAC.1